ncbi:MAG: hypothetical protein NTW21_43710 [Verrucomicrobia bacterium]|nr:hypothetical protein [Verrucomicrobiota bacterium]
MSGYTVQEILAILQTFGLIGVGWLVAVWMPKYWAEKAKNLAQKEDLDLLTGIVEGVKNRFERRTIVYRAQFDVEFARMQEIWKSARYLDRIFTDAFPHPGFASTSIEKFTVFKDAQIGFLDALDGSRPFIPLTVLEAFMRFDGLMVDAKERGLSQHSETELADVRKEVASSFDAIEHSIRSRLEELIIFG